MQPLDAGDGLDFRAVTSDLDFTLGSTTVTVTDGAPNTVTYTGTALEYLAGGQGDDVLVFDPTRVTDGIDLSDDQILRFRPRAYAASVTRRSGAPAPASLGAA